MSIVKSVAKEVNYDGLVGSTHNYAGLAFGNVASQIHAKQLSNPRQAVQEGLKKMRFLHQLGCPQAIIPPQQRPNIQWLRQLGYSGKPIEILQAAYRTDPRLVAIAYSASSMWAANAATLSPSSDCQDGKIHITPANLLSQSHRFQESQTTSDYLKQLFPNEHFFSHHEPLPATSMCSDEGAANHARLCHQYGDVGFEIFVYGKSGFSNTTALESMRYPARQSLIASQSIARSHQCDPARILFLQQNPNVIDQGVFHNDVIAVANQNWFFCHESAYVNPSILRKALAENGFQLLEVAASDVTIEEAVQTYLFNSQLISLPNKKMVLVAPQECANHPRVKRYLDELLEKGEPFSDIHYVECRQSMQNGGGPACLRLRVVMTAEEYSAAHQAVMFTDELYKALIQWSERFYREVLSPQDLLDPLLIEENENSLGALSSILELNLRLNNSL